MKNSFHPRGRFQRVCPRFQPACTRFMFVFAMSLCCGLGGFFTLPTTLKAEAFTFAAYGDMPYHAEKEGKSDKQILEEEVAPRIQGNPNIPFVVNYGDLGRPEDACTDGWLEFTKDFWENKLQKPVFYTPGDNEWTDCDRKGIGLNELTRLDRLREFFFKTPATFDKQWRYKRQDQQPENQTWWYKGVLFVTQHYVSVNNGRNGINIGDKALVCKKADERDQQNKKWLKSAFHAAETEDVKAVIVIQQLDPFFKQKNHDCPKKNKKIPFYQDYRLQLQTLAFKLKKPVLLIHGDTNPYCLDQPFNVKKTPNLWRLNGPGDYRMIDMALVTVDPAQAIPFKVTGLLSGEAAPTKCDCKHLTCLFNN